METNNIAATNLMSLVREKTMMLASKDREIQNLTSKVNNSTEKSCTSKHNQ